MATGMHGEVEFSINTTKAKRSAEKAAGELNRIIGGVGQKQVNFNINSRSFTQPLGRITGSANEFTKSLEASNARVIAFGASVGIINGISDAFKNLVAETVRFEKTLSDVNVVLDVSNASLQKFGQGLFDVAKNTAQSFGVAAEAALEFSRQGLTMEEVLKRTNDALTLTRLTGLKATEAVSGLTAAVNAFSAVGLTTTQVIDKLAAVDVKFAVSSEDLINALERTGAVAIDAGVELDSLIGLVTSLQQTTARGGSVIGNGLKTIFTRIQRPKSLAQIEELDIAVRNLSGAILPADKILINIAKSFDTLTSSQKSNIVQFSAGIFQANVFRAALRDLGKTQSIQAKATEVSAGAAGEAAFKNEKLNKTIAALASQSGSAIEELAGVLGELMVKPEIGGFLELFKDGIQGITNMLGGGEETGSTFAKGLVAGIGNVITGPAAIAFGAVFIKLFMNIAKFAQGSLKDVLDIVSRKDKIKKIEESILETLSKNKDVQESLNRLDGDREAQGKFILKIIEAQTNGMREQAALAKQLARPLLDAGVKTDLTVGGDGPVDLDGDGVMDSFGAARGILPSSARSERKTAARGGYSAGAVDSMAIAGVGKVVYNRAETVKQFPGMKQPAIMPPRKSRAGAAYQDAFSQKHGFDPYASGGYIPNFAALNGDTLRLNQSKMELYANPREATPGGNAVRNAMKALVDSGKPVTVSATTDKLLRGEGGSHTKAIKGLIRFIADQENGPQIFERNFKLTNLPWKGNKGEDASEDAVAKMLNKGGGKFINTGKRPGAHGDKTFPVDLIGSGLDPVEVKSGEWQQPNILLKSMRLYSDDELMQFAERQYGATPEILKGARMEKLGKSARLLQGKGLLDKNASLEEQHNAALKYGIAGGFVPNYLNQTDGAKKREWVAIADWVKKQKGKTILRTQSLDEMKKAGVSVSAKSPKSMADRWSRLLGLPDKSENLSVQGTAREALGTEGYEELLKNAREILPVGQRAGAASTGPRTPLPAITWKPGDKFSVGATLGDIMSKRGGLSLAQLNGAAFRGTAFGQERFNKLANTWGGKGGLSKLAGTSYAAGITPWHPYAGENPLSQRDLQNAGIDDVGFEELINKAGGFGTRAPYGAPLDFLGPNGEAKFVKGIKSTGEQGTAGGFYWSQVIGKILRSQIGNSMLKSDTTAKKFQDMWRATESLSTNLFAPKLASGFTPNFAGNTMLYRGTSPRYQKAIPDIPNAPQFLFEEIMAAKTKGQFIKAVEMLGRQHATGKYSGSYNDKIRGATLGEIRGREKLGRNKIQHGGYVYSRATKGMETTSPSGFVSKSTDKGVAQSFAKALVPGMEYNPKEMGQINESTVSNSRIFDQEKIGKFIDRFGLERVQQSFKEGMKGGNLKDVYLNLHKFKPKKVTDALDMFSNSGNDHSYRSIGMSGSGLSRDEKEITQIWSKNSPYYGAYGMTPNFADNRNRQQKIRDVLGDPSNAGINFKGGKPRSIKSKNMFQKMWLESYLKTGLEGDYQMLMKMGYDPDELLSLRSFASKGGEVDILGKGFVPNFANPLKEAIAREAGAGIPKSQIRVEQSGQLRGPGNPMGLAVTNKRDEPLGVGQGIRRARSMGMDPRRHGAASGMIPNFADDDGFEIPAALLKVLNEAIEATSKALKEKIPEATEEASNALKELPLATEMNVRTESTEEGKLGALEAALKKEGEKAGADQNPELIKKLEKATSAQQALIKAIAAEKSAPGAMGDKIKKTDKQAAGIIAAARKMEFEQIKKLTLAQKDEQKAIEGTVKKLQDLQDSLHDSEEASKDESDERGNGLQKLFYMQSAISMVNGFLEQFSEGATGATKTFLDLASAASSVTAAHIQQKEFANQGMNMLGVGSKEKGFSIGGLLGGNEAEKGQARATEARIRGENLQARGGKGLGSIGKTGAMIGKLGRTFGRFLPVVGQLYTAFTALDEGLKFFSKAFDLSSIGLEKGEGIMDLFASASTRATKRMEELSKTADSLKAALGGLETQDREQIELRKLENKGTSRTIAEEKKYYDLRLKSIDTDIALSKAMGNLMNENKTGRRSLERINRVIGSTTMSMSEQREGIRDLIIANQMLMAATSQRAGFQEGIDRADSDEDSNRLMKLAETRGGQMGLAMGGAFEGKKGASSTEKVEALSQNIRELQKAMLFNSGNASGALKGLNFNTNEAIGSTGIAEMLRGVIQDIDSFEWNTGGLSEKESKAYKKSVQNLIAMLEKRKDAQSKGAKDDIDIRIESLKQLKIAIFKTEQDREIAKQSVKMRLEQKLHDSSLIKARNDILKDYEGISNQSHVELKAVQDRNDLNAKFNSAEETARMEAIKNLDKIVGAKLVDPDSVSSNLKTELRSKSEVAAQAALKKFREATMSAAASQGPLSVGGRVVTTKEKKLAENALRNAADRGMIKGKELDIVKKLQFIHEEMQNLESARLRAIVSTLLSDKEVIVLKQDEKNKIGELLREVDRQVETRKKTNELDKETQDQARIQSLIAAKTADGAKELEKLLKSGVPLHKTIAKNLEGEAATLAVINKFQQNRLFYLKYSQDFSKKTFETQKEKNRTEGESQLLALRQLQYQEDGLALSHDSQIAQEAKLKMEILTASQSARESEAQRKFFSNLENRRALVDKQISAEMSGLKHTQGINQETLKQKVLTVKIKDMAKLELREQETALSTEALKNAELATNLSHLREAGSLTDMANRLQEKSNKLIEAQNAVRQASISRGDLAFNTRADLNIEEAGAVAGTKTAAMRSLMTNSPEDALAFASALEATNKQLGIGSRAVDRLRVRMTELDVSAKNLGADLVELGFDGVRSGFKNLLEQIGTGAKSAGDAWKEFGLNLTKTLLDRITDHNIDRIVKDLSFAFTGVEVKSEAEKIASSNSHLMDHLSSLTTSNDSLKDGILSLERQLKEGIKLRPPAKDESTKPVIPDKIPTTKFDHGLGPNGGRKSGKRSVSPPLPATASNPAATQRLSQINFNNAAQQNKHAQKVVPFVPPVKTAPVMPSSIDQKVEELTELYARQDVASATTERARKELKSFQYQRSGRSLFNSKAGEGAAQFKMPAEDADALFDLMTNVEQFKSYNDQGSFSGIERSLLKGGSSQTYRPTAQTIRNPIDSLIGFMPGTEGGGMSGKNTSNSDILAYRNFANRREAVEKKIKSTDPVASPTQFKKLTEELQSLTAMEKEASEGMKATIVEEKRLRDAVSSGKKTQEDLATKITALSDTIIQLRDTLQVQPTATPNQGGGIIQHFADGGYVKGPGGKDKVPAMLTAGEFVIPKKEVDNIQKFNDGTDKKGAEKKSTPGERLQSGVEGGLKMWAMSETAKAVAKAMDDDVDTPPTFNMKKLDNLDLGSDVNIKRGDPRLSSKFLARDPIMQEYRDYLIESANYKAQKTNENFRENMSTFASVFSAVTSFVTAEIMSYAAPIIQKGMGKATDYFKGDLGLGKHSDAYRDLKGRGFDPSYSDVSQSLESGKDLVLHRNKGKPNESEYSFKPYNGKFRDDKSNTSNTGFEFMAHRSQIHGRKRMAPTRPGTGAATFDKTQVDAIDFFNRNRPRPETRQGGGSIPAMLTAGEGYIPEPIAKRIGYNNLSHMNNTGTMPIVKGTGGVDNVGPVGLNSGDFIMKKSSTNKLLRDNPNAMRFSLQGQSDGRRGAQGYYEGGIVGSELTVPAGSLGTQQSQQGNRLGLLDQKESEKSDSGVAGSTTNAETTNNININISIDKAGAEVESQEGGEDSYEKERNLSMKIKGAVLEVIREEKRIGGELSE